ncbi:MAG: ECF-type sigma factor [Acidobacteriota bacterium]
MQGHSDHLPASADVTACLRRWSGGDSQALERCLPVVYRELERIAARYLTKERRDHTLEASALVHEAYLKLAEQRQAVWLDRCHFYAVSSRLMRRLLVDHARRRLSDRRGGGTTRVEFQEGLLSSGASDPSLIALDEALAELEVLDPELSEVVEMRFFAGMDNEEIAEALEVSSRTVIRRWRTARAWLLRSLEAERGALSPQLSQKPGGFADLRGEEALP